MHSLVYIQYYAYAMPAIRLEVSLSAVRYCLSKKIEFSSGSRIRSNCFLLATAPNYANGFI